MKITGLFISSLLLILFPVSVFAFTGNGSGTELDPYQISNVDQLQEMNDDLDAYYILVNDIDASATSGWNSGERGISGKNLSGISIIVLIAIT